MKRRLVFISAIATPQQVKFCYALQEYFDAEFWFYEQPDRTRGTWWRVELGDKCRVLRNVTRYFDDRYICWSMSDELARFDPDIVMVGGMSSTGNYLAYRWAARRNKQTVVFTERSRDQQGRLRRYGLIWALLRWMYRELDLVIVSAEDAVSQFRDDFGFGDKVVAGRYASDLDAYFAHPVREAKPAYTYIFANRLTELYDPVKAIDIFARILRSHSGSRLLMNAAGELRDACEEKIAELGVGESVEFLTELRSWNDLSDVYARSDLLILPARFSNGNFTILEAMASGMGIVVSDRVLGIGKLVEDGRNGFNCEPTVEAFVERIERYIRDPGLYKAHAELNRRLVEPLSVKGTARFVAQVLRERLGA